MILPQIIKDNLTFNDFVKELTKGTKKHLVKDSYGVYAYYKYYRKNRPKEKEYVLTEKQYYKIIRDIHELMLESLIKGNIIKLPYRCGQFYIRGREKPTFIKDGKLICRRRIHWRNTLKLWYEDQEAYENKTLVRLEDGNTFKIVYSNKLANFNNKIFYSFRTTRKLMSKLGKLAKENKLNYYNKWNQRQQV